MEPLTLVLLGASLSFFLSGLVAYRMAFKAAHRAEKDREAAERHRDEVKEVLCVLAEYAALWNYGATEEAGEILLRAIRARSPGGQGKVHEAEEG